MKTVILLLMFCSIFVIGSTKTNAQAAGCNNGTINGIYYTSCFPRQGTETDDTARIQRAVNSTIESGKLIFNEGLYQVSDTILLHSNLILEGTSSSTVEDYSKSSIKLTATNKAVFKIPSNRYEITIRDIGLTATSTQGTVGILAEGHNTSAGCPNGGASVKFVFSNIKFSGLGKGIYVNTDCGYPDWQFDNVKIDNCTFEVCTTGIEIRAQNSGFHINNIALVVPVGGYGINVIHGGYMSLNLVVGHGQIAGTPPNQTMANTFIKLRNRSVVSIMNSTNEGFQTALDIDADDPIAYRTFPITLINNGFVQGNIKDSTVISVGNLYRPTGAKLLGNTHLYSFGDKFCWETFDSPQTCKTGDFEIPQGSNAKVFFKSSEKETKIDNLKLGSVSFTNLGTPDNGTLLYCSDCQQTNPCQSGGSGALAKRIAGAWRCN